MKERPPRPHRWDYASCDVRIRKIVDGDGNFDFDGAPPQSRVYVETEIRTGNPNQFKNDSRVAEFAIEYRRRQRGDAKL